MKRLLNDGWSFYKCPVADCSIDDIVASKKDLFSPVDLPHDFLIYQAKNLYETCDGWYRRILSVSDTSKKHFLYFEGIYMDSKIYVNGKLAFEWKYGYSSFEVDITDFVISGDNEIIVHIRHQSPNSRWYSGAGIYRNVWYYEKDSVYILNDSLYVSTNRLGENWEVICSATASMEGILCFSLSDASGKQVASSIAVTAANEETSVRMLIYKPLLWTLDIPHLYKVHASIVSEGEVKDETSTSIGFRTLTFTTNEGLFLNDKHIKLNGVCEHHDLGALGAAVNRQAIRRKLKKLKQMGVNAIRTSHNMPAVEWMELCDEMGFLVVSEGFDMWERSKTEYDYARFFKDWCEKDVKSWIMRDRNHPCLLMWSIGNEIYDTHADEHGQEIMKKLIGLVSKYDYRQNAKVTFGSNFMPWENTQKCADIIKYVGYNYGEYLYDKHHSAHEDWYIYGSETASVVSSRGIYHFPANTPILSDDDMQCSSLGNSTTSWGAKSHLACILDDRDATYSLGQFIWTGFDYIGEPTPYHTKNSYFGQIDTAGFCKDSYYLFQAEWTDYHYAPMIHICPYWDFNNGQLIDVKVYSNAPKIELYLNDRLVGTHTCDHTVDHDTYGLFQLPYEEGTLLAIANDEVGNELCKDIRKSFKDAKKIVLTPDKKELLSDGEDMIFVEISMTDENGNPVENANNRVYVSVTGAARLVGLDNGDSTDYDEYKGTSRRLFSGKLLAMLAAKTEPGEIEVSVSSTGLPTETLSLYARKKDSKEGISATWNNIPSAYTDEIPVRKIEILSNDGLTFSKEKNCLTLIAKTYPENATFSDISWRATNEGGVDTNLASIVVDENDPHICYVTAKGDGKFFVRCLVNNGKQHADFYSCQGFVANGLGDACFDPYKLISGSLYTLSEGKIGTGNERGVAFDRDGDSQVTFSNILFDSYGSDKIVIPFFELENRPLDFEIWLGDENSPKLTCLGNFVYDKPTIWNVYQEETFQLTKRLTGLVSLTFCFKRKVHMKGFYFIKQNKAFEKLPARLYSSIYGDSFTLTEDAILGIGNNVTISFDDMDFLEKGCEKIIICGKSKLPKNTIHIRFFSEEGEIKQLAEFSGCEDYEEQCFALTKVTGVQRVSFIFLPGCDFDFKYFKFE